MNVAGVRAPRADAVANRARILAAATAAFEAGGVQVSLDEIARRAGVGPGTVHRHFPTKAVLIDATLAAQVTDLVALADGLREDSDPTEAFCGFLGTMVERGVTSHALADRLRSAGGDVDAAVAGPVGALRAVVAALLGRAQQAGGVRADVSAADVDALVAGAYAVRTHPAGGPRLVRLLFDSLRTG